MQLKAKKRLGYTLGLQAILKDELKSITVERQDPPKLIDPGSCFLKKPYLRVLKPGTWRNITNQDVVKSF